MSRNGSPGVSRWWHRLLPRGRAGRPLRSEQVGRLGVGGWRYRDGVAPAPQDFVVRKDPYAKKRHR